MKKFFAKIHLWLSIPFGIIIAIVCLTGAILVFETEILELCYPSRYFVKEVKGEMLSPAVLMGAARPATSRLHQNKRDTGFLRPQTDLPTDFTRKKGCLLYQSLHRRNYRHRRWKRVLHEDNAPSPLAVGRI